MRLLSTEEAGRWLVVSLHPEHLADLLKSGLTDETIRAAELSSVHPSDLAQPPADELQRLAKNAKFERLRRSIPCIVPGDHPRE